MFLPIFIEHATLEICDSETSCLLFLTTFILKVWKTVLKCRWHPLTNFVALSKPFNHSVTQCLHFKMGSQDLSGIVIGKMKDNVGRAHQNLSINEMAWMATDVVDSIIFEIILTFLLQR